MRVHRRHAATTLAAAGMIVVLTLVFAAYAVEQIATIDPERSSVAAEEARLGLDPQMANNVTAITATLVLAVCVLTLGAAIGIVRRSVGTRYAAIGLFGMLALVAIAAAGSGLTATPRSPNAWYGLLCGLADVGIVGLLLAPSTADDFDRVDHERRWLVARGYPLAADRTTSRVHQPQR